MDDDVTVGRYRTGNHNPRNVYRAGLDRDTDEQVLVTFTPEMGKLVTEALNRMLSDPTWSKIEYES